MKSQWSAGRDLTRIAMYGLSVVTVLAVAYRFVGPADPISQAPDADHLRTPWACHSCGLVITLTPKQRVEMQRRTGRVRLADDLYSHEQRTVRTADLTLPNNEEDEDQASTSFRELILGCHECGRVAVHKALTCSRCQTIFPRVLEGKPQRCPQCKWNPSTSLRRVSKPSRPRQRQGLP